MLDAMSSSRFLDDRDHALQRLNRCDLQAECEREEEHDLGIGGTLYRREQFRIDRQHQVASDLRVFAYQAVVHEEPASVAKRMAVGFLSGGVGGCAYVRDEKRCVYGARRFAQVAVAPGRLHASIAKRGVRRRCVPAHPKAIPVSGRVT
jgi:hypothetical protein